MPPSAAPAAWRQRRRQTADDAHAMALRVYAEDLVARPRAVGPAGDEQAPADRRGCGVAHRMGEGGDLARRAPGRKASTERSGVVVV